MVTVEHNPDRLPCRLVIRPKSLAAAARQIQRLMEVKRPRGMRLRHTPDYPSGLLFLEARDEMPIIIARRCLADAGMIREVRKL